MSHPTNNGTAEPPPLPPPLPQRKRHSDAGEELRTRPAMSSPHDAAAPVFAMPAQSHLELRAYGLEDRADAVISTGSKGWALNNLSQWRQEILQQQSPSLASTGASEAEQHRKSQEYIAQRQRLFKQQMLRGARQQQPSPSSQ